MTILPFQHSSLQTSALLHPCILHSPSLALFSQSLVLLVRLTSHLHFATDISSMRMSSMWMPGTSNAVIILPYLILLNPTDLLIPHIMWKHTTKAKTSSSMYLDCHMSVLFLMCVASYWNFEAASDPTHGLVTYQSRDQAMNKGLAYVENGTTVLSVDINSAIPSSGKRDSWVDFRLTVSVILTCLLLVQQSPYFKPEEVGSRSFHRWHCLHALWMRCLARLLVRKPWELARWGRNRHNWRRK